MLSTSKLGIEAGGYCDVRHCTCVTFGQRSLFLLVTNETGKSCHTNAQEFQTHRNQGFQEHIQRFLIFQTAVYTAMLSKIVFVSRLLHPLWTFFQSSFNWTIRLNKDAVSLMVFH